MCGHGTIGLVASLAYLGRIQPGTHGIETPVGTVTTTLHEDGSVSVRNVPAYRLHHQLAVDGNAQPHVVDGFTGTAPAGIAKRGGVVHLAVVQLAFDVPQPIVAFIALVIDAALVPGGAGGRGAQGHGEEKTSCKSERGRAEATMLAAHRRAVVHRRDRACRSQPC